MESKWRTNVWEYGFWGEYYEMCSRELGNPNLLLMWSPPEFPIFEVWLEDPGSDLGWVFLGYFNKPFNRRHFPYGNEVQPD